MPDGMEVEEHDIHGANPAGPPALAPAVNKSVAKAPPVYTGSGSLGALDWIFLVELFMAACHGDVTKWAIVAASYLAPTVLNIMFANKDVSAVSALSWDEFKKLFLEHATMDDCSTDLQCIMKIFNVRTAYNQPCKTQETVHTVENLMNKCKETISDNVKIALVYRAIHPDLRPDVAYQPDGRSWASYKDFRTNLNSVASHFDERHNAGRHFNNQQYRSPSRQSRFQKRNGNGNGNGFKPRHNGQGNGARHGGFKPRYNNRNQNSNGMKCWGCGKFGHVQANCPNAAQVSVELLPAVVCNNRFAVLANMPEAVEPVELSEEGHAR